jgi:hypothetical protein
MPQAWLMRFEESKVNDNYFSFAWLVTALPCFLNPLHPSVKGLIRLGVIDLLENLLQTHKKVIVVSHIKTLEFLFHYRNQIEVTGSQIRRTRWVWYLEHIIFMGPLWRARAYVSQAITNVNHNLVLMRALLQGKNISISGVSVFVIKYSVFILTSFGNLRTTEKQCGFDMMVNMNSGFEH